MGRAISDCVVCGAPASVHGTMAACGGCDEGRLVALVVELREALAAAVESVPCACGRYSLWPGDGPAAVNYVRGPRGEWHVADACRAPDGTVTRRPAEGGAS